MNATRKSDPTVYHSIDPLGTYYYLLDPERGLEAGGYSRREDAHRAAAALLAQGGPPYPPADVPLDGRGARLGICTDCRRVVPLFCGPDRDHADDCRWHTVQ